MGGMDWMDGVDWMEGMDWMDRVDVYNNLVPESCFMQDSKDTTEFVIICKNHSRGCELRR